MDRLYDVVLSCGVSYLVRMTEDEFRLVWVQASNGGPMRGFCIRRSDETSWSWALFRLPEVAVILPRAPSTEGGRLLAEPTPVKPDWA